MLDEDECEIASCIGFTCIRCRPADQLPPHIQGLLLKRCDSHLLDFILTKFSFLANKNGTLRSLLNKKRSEEKQLDPTSTSKKSDLITSNDLPDATSSVADEQAPSNVSVNASETVPLINTPKLSKYHVMDGIFLSEQGFSFIKELTKEQGKKKRAKRKSNLGGEEQTDLQGLDENGEEKANDLESLAKNDERKGRQRRLEKLGIGGFTVKQRGRLSCNTKEDDETNQDNIVERSNTPDGDKPKRRRRITKKHKSQLQESFPSYMQEAFFGKDLLDTIHGNNNGLPSAIDASAANEEESEDDEMLDSTKSLNKESIIELTLGEITNVKSHKTDDLNDIFDDTFPQESLDDLPVEGFDDLQLSPDDMIMDMLINENLENTNDEELEDLTNGSKIDDDVKDDMDILDGNFNFNDIVDESGLPQMDSKDVEDLFNEVMSDSSIQQQLPQPESSQTPMMPKPIVEPLQMPSMMQQQKVEMPPSIHQPIMNVSTPVTSLSNDPFSTCRPLGPKPMGPETPIQQPNIATPPVVNQQFNQQMPNQALAESTHWQNNEIDNETATQGQKNYLKWEAEEALGLMATISPVLYANTAFPNLKAEYPVWSDRLKQISKLWRQLSTDQRQPFLQKARENRAASRVQKSQSQSSDSFGPPHASSLPSTPQPPGSPQLPAPSPLSDIYARSPATPRSAPVNTQIRPSFEESFNQRQMQPDLYSPTTPSGNFQQPYMQPNAYGMNEGFSNNPAAAKGQMRPNVPPVSIRPNVPLRRTVSSDPYARQPMTPMPGSSADTHSHYNKPEENPNDPMAKQQLRNLLQVQQIRRQDSNTPQPRPPNWTGIFLLFFY